MIPALYEVMPCHVSVQADLYEAIVLDGISHKSFGCCGYCIHVCSIHLYDTDG